jgi:hypothetical protein
MGLKADFSEKQAKMETYRMREWAEINKEAAAKFFSDFSEKLFQI